MPGLIKIGRTDRTLEQRMKELNTTGVPTPFVLEHSASTTNSLMAEKEIHAALVARGVRNTDSREFFRMDIGEAKQLVDAIAGLYCDEVEVDPQTELNKTIELLAARFYAAKRPSYVKYLDGYKLLKEYEVSQYENEFLEIAELGYPVAYKELGKIFSTVYPDQEKWKRYERASLSFFAPFVPIQIMVAQLLNDTEDKSAEDFASSACLYILSAYVRSWIEQDDIEFIGQLVVGTITDDDQSCHDLFLEKINALEISRTLKYRIAKVIKESLNRAE